MRTVETVKIPPAAQVRGEVCKRKGTKAVTVRKLVGAVNGVTLWMIVAAR